MPTRHASSGCLPSIVLARSSAVCIRSPQLEQRSPRESVQIHCGEVLAHSIPLALRRSRHSVRMGSIPTRVIYSIVGDPCTPTSSLHSARPSPLAPFRSHGFDPPLDIPLI